MDYRAHYICPCAARIDDAPDVVWNFVVPSTHRWLAAAFDRGLLVSLGKHFSLFGSLIMLLAIVGCDGTIQHVAVSGQVLLDGEPLTKGTIRFVPTTGRPASSRIMEDGSFRVAMKSLTTGAAEVVGLLPGNYRIAISATEDLGEAENAEVRWLVPRRYGDFRTSGLEAEILEPTESLNVELTWEGSEEMEAEAGTDKSSPPEEDRNRLEPQNDES